jgi:hypothetical protein
MAGLLKLCLASLSFHQEWLKQNLPAKHHLLSTWMFAVKNTLFSKIRCDHSSSYIHATGIPPHVEVYKQLKENAQALQDLPDIIISKMSNLIEEKGVAAGNITKELLTTTLRNIIQQESLFRQQEQRLQEQPAPKYKCYMWGGRMHILPQTFVLPCVDVKTAWQLWWLGNQQEQIPPYKDIKTCDLSTRAKKQKYSEWKVLMQHLEGQVKQKIRGQLKEKPKPDEVAAWFTSVEHSTVLGPSHRNSQLKMTTILKRMREHGAIRNSSRIKRPYKQRKKAQAGTASREETDVQTALLREEPAIVVAAQEARVNI